MYLDNSGEAYFIQEVDDDKGIESNGVVQDSNNEDNSFPGNVHRHDHSVSDSVVLQLKGEGDSSMLPRIQRAEPDGDRRFCDFQENRSSFEDPIELPEYGSNAYESLEGENFEDSHGSHPEMVLFDTDGVDNTSEIPLEVSKERDGHIRQARETLGIENQDLRVQADSEGMASD
ncbi:unnamed protein product [Lupinus luteus]|uniref:Uncharacterized protein n=1 Tax=Lupinus luteus TaxID=3873 RepID=A0AAV1Y1T7_LUPLU